MNTGDLAATRDWSWYDGMAVGGGCMTGQKRYVSVWDDGAACARGGSGIASFFSCSFCSRARACDLGPQVCAHGVLALLIFDGTEKPTLLGMRLTPRFIRGLVGMTL